MENVMQYNYQANSPEEAKIVADGLRMQVGCLDARTYGYSSTAHFEVDQDIPEEALPEGCRLVPRSIVQFLQGKAEQSHDI